MKLIGIFDCGCKWEANPTEPAVLDVETIDEAMTIVKRWVEKGPTEEETSQCNEAPVNSWYLVDNILQRGGI